MRPRHEVADVFRQYGEEYRRSYPMTLEQKKVMGAIMFCRTAHLGGHVEVCDHCGTAKINYNSCRNRHCPKCQTMTKEKWLDRRCAELLPCGYFHLVFTLPHELNKIVLANRRIMLSSLFHSVKSTLFAFAADPQWKLMGKPGAIVVLHTWSQTMIDHFHLHCLIPAGVLSHDNRQWVPCNDKFLFGVKSLAKEFKKQYLGLVEKKLPQLVLPERSESLLSKAWQKKWIVYAKKPFGGPEQVLKYLGRYTHRVALSNHRIKSIKDNEVVFTYKDRNDENKTKTMKLDAMEFIRRFLLHVLPIGFMKIRYYGFLANACKKKAVLLIRKLIGKPMEIIDHVKETLREQLLRITGRDIMQCPHCSQGKMIYQWNITICNTS